MSTSTTNNKEDLINPTPILTSATIITTNNQDNSIVRTPIVEKDLEAAIPAGNQSGEAAATSIDESESVETLREDGSVVVKSEEVANWRDNNVQTIPDNNLPVVFAGLMLCTFLAALDSTIVATANPTIVRELGGDYSAYSWIGVSYLLTATAFSPLYGKLSTVFGRKILLYFSILCFIFGSALCGAAQSIIWLCACRGVQGIGGGKSNLNS